MSINRNPKWWQVWNPYTGLRGGIIFSIIPWIIAYGIYQLLEFIS